MLRTRETKMNQTCLQGLTVWWALPWPVHLSTSDKFCLGHSDAPTIAIWLVFGDGDQGQEALFSPTMAPCHHSDYP